MEYKVLIQNIARNRIGKVKGGGNCAKLRIDIHNANPNFVILSEINEEEGFTGQGAFRGYALTQYSQNGARVGGIAVFVKKGIENIDGTVRNSRGGHFTVGAYKVDGATVVLGAIYGPSTANDTQSADIFRAFFEQITELGNRLNTRRFIIGGDFNVKLDQNRVKPRTAKLIKDFINELNLIDTGAERGAEVTWRRPRRAKSRLDYLLLSNDFKMGKFTLQWGKYDHAQLFANFTLGQ